MVRNFLRVPLFVIATTLFALSVLTVAFHTYGSLTAKSFLADKQGFVDVKIGVYLAQDRCYPSQYFRYRFEATDHLTDGSTEKVAGEVCGGGNETNWFSGYSPLGHFAPMHSARKEALIKDAWIALFVQLTVLLSYILVRKEGGVN
ncbi:MAG: hypothetical protein HN392_11340 [Anaerolineae bacterium]|jgi:hypothetical protein|nr:hypothetical protein [Anaerolineae bacterium]